VLVFLLALGITGTLYLAQGIRERDLLEPYQGGQSVIGRVVSTEIALDTNPKTWVSVIRYRVDGQAYQVRSLDTSQFLTVGSLQVLSYLPRSPSQARDLSQRRGQWSEPIDFGVVADLCVLALGFLTISQLAKLRGWTYSASQRM
jgi:hypothetical protein